MIEVEVSTTKTTLEAFWEVAPRKFSDMKPRPPRPVPPPREVAMPVPAPRPTPEPMPPKPPKPPAPMEGRSGMEGIWRALASVE